MNIKNAWSKLAETTATVSSSFLNGTVMLSIFNGSKLDEDTRRRAAHS